MSSSVSSGPLRMRRSAVALTIAVVAAVLVPVSTSAALAAVPASAPSITAPVDATIVDNPQLSASAASGAAQVRFVLDGREGNPDYDKTVPVSGGSASTQFSVLGLSGSTQVDAYDCDDVGSCNTIDKDTVTVTVDLSASLNDPAIISPGDSDVVHSSVTVRVDAPGPTIQFFVNGNPVGKDTAVPLERKISLSGYRDGLLTIKVRQCSTNGTVCEGEEDSITVVKDTKGPKFTDVDSSLGTVYPVRDNFKDTVKLSARVAEKSLGTKVEIRKAGGPLVRTLKLGRENAGRLSVSWNGRKSNGAMVPKGKYLFRFVGTDVNGVVGTSNDKVIRVSDKKLVKKSATKTVSAKGSFVGDGSGRCSGVYSLVYQGSKYGWRSGAGYYSRASCNGTQADDLALGFHRTGVNGAIRYGSLRIDTYGGGAARKSGPGVMVMYKSNLKAGANRQLSARLGWHAGPSVNMSKYVKGGKVRWGLATIRGNWYDVKEYRIAYTYFVLR